VQLPRILHLPTRGSGPKDCTCGHAENAHEHYRRGRDCALCSCARFRAGAAAKGRDQRDSRGEQARAA
jgi:hypothetical protein